MLRMLYQKKTVFLPYVFADWIFLNLHNGTIEKNIKRIILIETSNI